MAFKVVIAALNSQYIHSALAPWCLKAGIEKYGDKDIETIIVEGHVNQKKAEIIDLLVKDNPDILGISCYIWNMSTVTEIIGELKKKLPKTKIVLGGPEVSYNYKEVIKKLPEVDFILIGEGERSIAELANAIKNKTDFSKVGGLIYLEEGVLFENEIKNIDFEPPSPYSDEFHDRLGSKIAYLETSRGCPFSCAFCLSGRDDNVRFFSIDRAKKVFLRLANTDTRTIKLVDRTFNCDKKRAYELFEFIINADKEGKFKEGICFHFEVAADLFDDKTINLLSNARVGLIQMEAGLQSFNEATLEEVNRKTNIDILTKNLKKLLELKNIHIHIDLIAGLPLEGFESFENSFNKGYALKPHMLQLGFLKLIHGSKLRDDKKKYGYEYDENPPYEVYSTNWLTLEQMEVIHGIEQHLDKLYNSKRFFDTLDYVFEKTNLKPFDLYKNLWEFSLENGFETGMSLEKYIKIVYDFLKTLDNINHEKLRDVMVCDRLKTINTGDVPKFLRVKDDRLKALKRKFVRSGVMTGVAILYNNKKAVWADYKTKDELTGRYKLNYIDEKELNNSH